MLVVLKIVAGPSQRKKIWLRPGQRLVIGRSRHADAPLTDDYDLAQEHFSVDFDGQQCRVAAYPQAQLTVNEILTQESFVRHGDRIAAGRTTFEVEIEGSRFLTPVLPPAATAPLESGGSGVWGTMPANEEGGSQVGDSSVGQVAANPGNSPAASGAASSEVRGDSDSGYRSVGGSSGVYRSLNEDPPSPTAKTPAPFRPSAESSGFTAPNAGSGGYGNSGSGLGGLGSGWVSGEPAASSRPASASANQPKFDIRMTPAAVVRFTPQSGAVAASAEVTPVVSNRTLMELQVILQVVSGPAERIRIWLHSGQIVSVGRTSWADVRIVGDPTLGETHFTLECDYKSCLLIGLDPTKNPTLLNGRPITRAAVRNGDRITAGQTTFMVRIENEPPPEPAPPVAAAPTTNPVEELPEGDLQERALHVLNRQPEPLFAILDAAIDPAVLKLLHRTREEYQSLYSGEKAEELANVAPYLVRLPPRCSLLEPLIRQGWGKHWGVFLTCDHAFEDVRLHLKRFLQVQVAKKTVYFRFYDPRVLRSYLPSCTLDETRDFLGPLLSYLVESKPPNQWLRFTLGKKGVRQETIPLASDGK